MKNQFHVVLARASLSAAIADLRSTLASLHTAGREYAVADAVMVLITEAQNAAGRAETARDRLSAEIDEAIETEQGEAQEENRQ